MRVWVCSDLHLNHFNIIKYCNRPFYGIEQMNSTLIKNWNDCVDDEDIVIFCGDFCFARTSEAAQVTERFTRALRGHKVIIKGNHDFKKLRYTDLGWDREFYQEFSFGRFDFRHRPDDLSAAAREYDFVFYGHVHDKVIGDAPYNTINACLDVHDFKPLDITDYFTKLELEELAAFVKGE